MRIWTKSLTGNLSTFLTIFFRGGLEPPLKFRSTKSETMPMKPDFVFYVAPSKLRIFHSLLQQGVRIKTRMGDSIHDFLSQSLGLSPESIEQKIQTVFLNGKAVDDLITARLRDGATLSLSGAMPGLLGATLRRGGFYAPMRKTITCQEEDQPLTAQGGCITLKVFNLLLSEIGPLILSRGFWIKGGALRTFLQNQGEDFAEKAGLADKDGSEMPIMGLLSEQFAGTNDLFHIQIKTLPHSPE
jgi:hypothetical protein